MNIDWKGTIITSIIIGVIFYGLFAIFNNPSSISSFIDKTKSSLQTNTQSQIQQDSSVTSCLNEIATKFKILKAKSPTNINIYVKEHKKFTSTQEAIDYLIEWDIINAWTKYELFPELYRTQEFKIFNRSETLMEYDDIVVALVRLDVYSQGQTFGSLIPIVCIDGTLTKTSEDRLSV